MAPRPAQDVLAELVGRIEDATRFDLEGFLSEHPEHATVLRERIHRLRHAGLMRAADGERGPSPGESIPSRVVGGRYRILAEIGRGGMGRVFRARDVDLGRDVALKVVDLGGAGPPEGPRRRALVERFLAEARVTAQLEHPSIVPLHDVGVDHTGELFYTMKLVEGRTLESLIDEWHVARAAGAGLPIVELLRIVLQICEALALAHERDVLHRDLKPSNVMVGRFGEVHVMDWGLAKLVTVAGPRTAYDGASVKGTRSGTETGDVLGTPRYMAPEQARGGAVDRRTDVYGVGAILHHALTGEPPNRSGLQDAARSRRPSAPADARDVPKSLRTLVRKALAPEPEDRYPTVLALADDVQAFLEDRPGAAWRDSALVRAAKLVRRHPTRAAVGVAAAVLLPLGLFGWQQRALYRLEATSRADVELRQSDAVTVGLLRGLRERYGFETPSGPIDHVAASRAHLRLFAERLVPIDDGRPIAEVGAELASSCRRRPELGRAVVDSLYDLSLALCASKIAHGVWLEGRAELELLAPAQEQEARDAARRHPELAAVWPRTAALIDALEDDEWRRRAWHDWERVMKDDAPVTDMQRYGEQRELAGKDAAQLVHVARLLHTSLGREAEHVYRLAESADPSLFWPHVALGTMAFERGDRDEVRRQYEMAWALNPGMGRVHSTLCGVYGDLELLPQAEAAGRRAIELIPESAPAHYNLALVFLKASRYEESIAELRRALDLHPDYAKAWDALGQALYATGRLADACEASAEAVRIEPDSIQCLRGAAFVWFQRLETERGLAFFERAVALDRGLTPLWLQALDVWCMLERELAASDSAARDGRAPAMEHDARETLLTQIERLVYATPPADFGERAWLAGARLLRGELVESADTFRPLIAQMKAADDPLALANSHGQVATALAWHSCIAAARAATGRGYCFVEGAALLEPGEADVVLGDVVLPRVRPSERPLVADYLREHPAGIEPLVDLAADGIELWVKILRADAASASPDVDEKARLYLVRQVLSEPTLVELRDRERIGRVLTELESWRDALEAAGAGR